MLLAQGRGPRTQILPLYICWILLGPAAPACFIFFLILRNNGEKSRKKGNIPQIKALLPAEQSGTGSSGGGQSVERRMLGGNVPSAAGRFISIAKRVGFVLFPVSQCKGSSRSEQDLTQGGGNSPEGFPSLWNG